MELKFGQIGKRISWVAKELFAKGCHWEISETHPKGALVARI